MSGRILLAAGPKTFVDPTKVSGQAWFFNSTTAYNGTGEVGYTWVVPTGVYYINCAAMGGGGAGGYVRSSAQLGAASGGGGGLSWRNLIQVTPGETLRIAVGNGAPVAGVGVQSNGGWTALYRIQNRGDGNIDGIMVIAWGGYGGIYYTGSPYGTQGAGGEGAAAARARLQNDGLGRVMPAQNGGNGGAGNGDNYSGSAGGAPGGYYGNGGQGGLGGSSNGPGNGGGAADVGSGGGAGGDGGGGASPYYMGIWAGTTQLYGHGPDGQAQAAVANNVQPPWHAKQIGSRWVAATKGSTDVDGNKDGNATPLDGTFGYWGSGGVGGGPINTGWPGMDGQLRITWGPGRQFAKNTYIPDV